MIHEFVCADCQAEVFTFDAPDAKVCRSCQMIRDMKARDPMTPEQEAALREILHCVIRVRKGPTPGTMEMLTPEEDDEPILDQHGPI